GGSVALDDDLDARRRHGQVAEALLDPAGEDRRGRTAGLRDGGSSRALGRAGVGELGVERLGPGVVAEQLVQPAPDLLALLEDLGEGVAVLAAQLREQLASLA